MKYFVYIIGSYKNCKLKTYVGYTNNLKRRLFLHNSNKGAKSTKGRKWKVLYYEKIDTKIKAMSREYVIKKNRNLRKNIRSKFLSTNLL